MTTTSYSLGSIRRIAVVVCLVLNSILATAPMAEAMPILFSAAAPASPCLQQQEIDMEETRPLQYQKNQRQIFRATPRHKMPSTSCAGFFYLHCFSNDGGKKTAIAYRARSSNLDRHDYYDFLSIYHLF